MEEKKGMTSKELYDYIVTQITPEQALMRTLEAGLRQYEKLKFDEGEAVDPLFIISFAAMDMGWQMAVEKGDPDMEIEGIAMGTEGYMKRLFNIKTKDNESTTD